MAMDRLNQICHDPFPIYREKININFYDGPGKPMNYKKNDWIWAKEYHYSDLEDKGIIYEDEYFKLSILWGEKE